MTTNGNVSLTPEIIEERELEAVGTDSRQYTNDQVTRIIRRALESKQANTIFHQDLVEIGKDLGISEDEILAAVRDEQRQQILHRKVQRKKVGFRYHLYSYISVNILLLIINLMTPGPWWFQWSILGWGIGLFSHYRVIQTTESKS